MTQGKYINHDKYSTIIVLLNKEKSLHYSLFIMDIICLLINIIFILIIYNLFYSINKIVIFKQFLESYTDSHQRIKYYNTK